MPRCRKCGTHWFNSAIRKCPICRTETVDGLAVDVSNQIRSRPGWSGNPQAVAANVLFHLSSKSEAAKKGLETLMRDDVLGIRSRAVQVCGQDKANRQVVQLLSKAANLESIVERGADDRMWTSEQLLKDIERTVGQSFENTAACLDWIRKNCFVN